MTSENKSSLPRGNGSTRPRAALPIVGIGASAGGIKALQIFFDGMTDTVEAAFVVIVHLDPKSQSELAAILGSHTRLRVTQVGALEPLESNRVYVIPPDRQLQITDTHIAAVPFSEAHGHRSPIDSFFRSLAEQRGDHCAVILTGAGSDGALGVKAVKEAGGIILVQDPAEAEYASMPRSAIATGVADFVLPLLEIAPRVLELIQVKKALAPETEPLAVSDQEHLTRILALVRARTGHDFANYKSSTVLRRIARRAQIAGKGQLADYLTFLRDNTGEAQALLGDLLISVTSFFRDKAAFAGLARVLPQLYASVAEGEAIRVWVAGCATGEEAYSIAILLLEEAAKHPDPPAAQVFASDLDARAIGVARDGVYPEVIAGDVSDERLRRFFTREGDHYRVNRELRDMIIFANHSVFRDPPFSNLDLVSCRNLLIYLDRPLQQAVLTTLHYGLKRGRFLFLGTSETAENSDGQFSVVDQSSRIYLAMATGRERIPLPPRTLGAYPRTVVPLRISTPGQNEVGLHRQALEQAAPPSVLVDVTGRAVHLSDSAGRYLLPSGGVLSRNLAELVRPELRLDTRAALRRAFERNEPTLSMPIRVRFDGDSHRVYLQVKPISEQPGRASTHALVLFIEGELVQALAESASPPGEGDVQDTIHRLEEELQIAQTGLRASREESEAATEELRAANEELQSINEEYRSTSEELETSKEELQSINEELQTLNGELNLRLEAISLAHSDLQNLIATTDLGTLFLDSKLRIKRFTVRTADLFRIVPGDEGRPITDFTHQLDYPALVDDVRSVLQNLAPIEREVASHDRRWFLARVRPYRTVEDKIDGVVVTFIDITERRAAEDALRVSEQRLRRHLGQLSNCLTNTLTAVQLVVGQSLQRSESDEAFMQRFNGYINALGRISRMLSETGGNGVTMETLVRDQLAPFTIEHPERARIDGPSVNIPPEVAMPTGLLLHELAMNAAKHGALKVATGRLNVTWALKGAGAGQTLSLLWEERDGPAIKAPPTETLVGVLIARALPEAQAHYDWHRDGVVCRIDIPWATPEVRRAA